MRLGTVCSARGLAAFTLLVMAVARPATAQQPSQSKTKEHIVKEGDTLWDLSQFYFSDPYRWTLIYDANRNVVKNPHWIYPTEKLVIPGLTAETTVEAARDDGRPGRSRFFVAGGNDTTTTLISAEVARPALVQPMEWLTAPWISDSAALGINARVFKPYDPRDQHDKLPQSFHPRDKLFITPLSPVKVNDRLLAIRFNRSLRGIGLGWIIEPLGVLRIDSVADGSAVATITSQFGDLKVGDLAIPMPAIPTMPTAKPVDVSGGPKGNIVDFMVVHPLYGNTDYAFIDIGATQGLAVGDELVAYLPERQPSKKQPEMLPEQTVAKLQVIRVTDRTATVRVVRLTNNGLTTGLPVRVARKAS